MEGANSEVHEAMLLSPRGIAARLLRVEQSTLAAWGDGGGLDHTGSASKGT